MEEEINISEYSDKDMVNDTIVRVLDRFLPFIPAYDDFYMSHIAIRLKGESRSANTTNIRVAIESIRANCITYGFS